MSSKTTRVASLLEAVPDALVGMDQEGVIRFVNRQTESLFGYDRDQLIGRPIETLVPESLWQIYAQHRENYFTDPRTRSSGLDVELIGRHQDGTKFPINISLTNTDTGDVLLVITAVHQDSRHGAKVRAGSGTGFDLVAQDEVGAGEMSLGVGEVFTQLCDGSGGAAGRQRVEPDGQRADTDEPRRPQPGPAVNTSQVQRMAQRP
jgi:PAS domain S-box-containing protein